MRGLLKDTVAELRSQKMAWVFGLVIIGALLAVMASGHIQVGSADDVDLNAPPEQLLATIVMGLFNGALQFLVFLFVMSTAGIMPSMFEKGRADFYISKPLSRSGLLWNKAFSVLVVYGAILLFAGLALLGTGYMIHGVFEYSWLVIMPLSVFIFALWYAISLCAGLAFGSGTSAIVVMFMIWVLQLVLKSRESIKAIFNSKILSAIVDTLYWVVPKPTEIEGQVSAWALNGSSFEWWALLTSAIFMLIACLVANEILKRRDF